MTSIVLWTLIPVTILTAILLSTLLYSVSIKKKKEKIMMDLDFEVKQERIVKLDSILNRVRIISKMNKSVQKLFDELTMMHTKINEELNECLNILGALTISQRTIRISKFDIQVKLIRDLIKDIDELQYQFEVKSERITQQDDFMGAEISFYTKNFRKTISVYRQKRVLLTKVADKLDVMLKELKNLEKEFHNALDKADIQDANILLNKYTSKVMKFSEIINEGPAIESYIYKTIPNLVKKIMEDYKSKKEEAIDALDHINFTKSINDIGNKYKKLRIDYLNLKLDKSKKIIKIILKSLTNLERFISTEIEAKNIFSNKSNFIVSGTDASLKIFKNIKDQIKDLGGRGVQISIDLNEEYNKLLKELKLLNEMKNTFIKSIDDKDLPYSGKVQRMKLLAQKNKMFLKKANIVNSLIWDLNIEKLIIKNKFRKAEGALNEIMASTKKEKLLLSDKENEEFEYLTHELSKLSPSIISENSSKELSANVNKIVEKIISYYQVVGGKIQIAEIVRNLIKEVSPKRALDIELNSQLGHVEAHYLKGQYDAALNLMIIHLEEAK